MTDQPEMKTGMAGKGAVEKRYPLIRETVEGNPIRVGGRQLIPIVQMTSYARRYALVGTNRLACRGGGFAHLRPVAVVERDEEGERQLPIQDRTKYILSGLLLAAFIIPLLMAVAVRLAREARTA